MEKSSTIERVFAASGFLIGIAGAFVVRQFDPVNSGFFPQCPLFVMTGLHCPGCGLTRGFHALFHGDILGAIDYNLLLPFFFIFGAYILASLFLTATRGRGLQFKIFSPWVLWSFLVFGLAFSVLRNLPMSPFNLLAP
jgi:Protein of unknown function (DUF2752)